jgi:hypothetical protein
MKNEYKVEGNAVMMDVEGKQVIFDLADFPAVDRFGSWKLARGTSISTDFRQDGKMCKVTLHKLLTGSKFVKWLNYDTFDFRRMNMQPIEKAFRPRPCGMTLKGNEYKIESGMIVIPVHSKGVDHEIWADVEDYELLSQYTWGVNSKTGYAQTRERTGSTINKGIYMHRLIMKAEGHSVKVDHINGLKLDNRRSNLRLCSNSENLHNSYKKRDGVVTGVQRVVRYEARIQINCVPHVKAFRTYEEAVAQRMKWESELNPSGLNNAKDQL